jgi:RNA polymerase sigma-70 factor (ECF subfamily)
MRREKIKNLFVGFSNEDEDFPVTTDIKDEFDIQELVRKGIGKLPEKLRAPMVMKDFEGFSYQEIAEILEPR